MLNQYINKKKNVMKYKFIPVNNDLNKAIAFANTIDSNNIKNVQRIKQTSTYIPTSEVIQSFQNEGWILKGVAEQRGSNRKISSNYVQLHHPDFELKNKQGKMEAISSLTISNSCSGKQPLTMNLGLYRQVCSNGLIAFDQHAETTKIKHIDINYRNLQNFIASINSKTDKVLKQFGILQNKNLTVEQAREFAYQAAKLKYVEEDIDDLTLNELLSVNRIEDKGNDVWTVFNRLQENLTHDVSNLSQDIRLNQQLFSLADQYALTV
jgi:hypothetical protein